MKRLLMLAMMAFSFSRSFSQDTYYSIFGCCDSIHAGHYEFGIEWKDQSDPSIVSKSDILFVYFGEEGCGRRSYRLRPNGSGEWIFAEPGLSIRICMSPVESYIGYSPYSIRIESSGGCAPSSTKKRLR